MLRQSLLVTPGRFDPQTGETPAGSFFFLPVWDPYERTATFHLRPRDRWIPDTLHTAVVLPPADPSDITGIRAFDGAPLEQRVIFSFTPSASLSDPDVDDAGPRVDWCDDVAGVAALPAARKAFAPCAGCHGPSDPAAGLDLSSPEAIRRTALRVLAAEVVPLEHAGVTAETPTDFGQGMARIDPGNPGNSYLVYKLLINRENYPQPGDPEASDPYWERGMGPLQAPSNDELGRLRDAFVWMEPMPLGGGLSVSLMRSLVTWIAQGAEVRDCP